MRVAAGAVLYGSAQTAHRAAMLVSRHLRRRHAAWTGSGHAHGRTSGAASPPQIVHISLIMPGPGELEVDEAGNLYCTIRVFPIKQLVSCAPAIECTDTFYDSIQGLPQLGQAATYLRKRETDGPETVVMLEPTIYVEHIGFVHVARPATATDRKARDVLVRYTFERRTRTLPELGLVVHYDRVTRPYDLDVMSIRARLGRWTCWRDMTAAEQTRDVFHAIGGMMWWHADDAAFLPTRPAFMSMLLLSDNARFFASVYQRFDTSETAWAKFMTVARTNPALFTDFMFEYEHRPAVFRAQRPGADVHAAFARARQHCLIHGLFPIDESE